MVIAQVLEELSSECWNLEWKAKKKKPKKQKQLKSKCRWDFFLIYLSFTSISPWWVLHWRQLNPLEWSLERSAQRQPYHQECPPLWEQPREGLRALNAWTPRAGSPSPCQPPKANGTEPQSQTAEGERSSPRGGAASKGLQTSSSWLGSAQANSLTKKGGKWTGPRAGSSPSAHLLHPRAWKRREQTQTLANPIISKLYTGSYYPQVLTKHLPWVGSSLTLRCPRQRNQLHVATEHWKCSWPIKGKIYIEFWKVSKKKKGMWDISLILLKYRLHTEMIFFWI